MTRQPTLCPQCQQPVDPKSAHIVVYPESEAGTYHHGHYRRGAA